MTVMHVLPELDLEKTNEKYSYPLKLGLFIFGVLVGWGLMYSMAIYEHDLYNLAGNGP